MNVKSLVKIRQISSQSQKSKVKNLQNVLLQAHLIFINTCRIPVIMRSSIFTLLAARGRRGGPTHRRAAALLARHRRRCRGVVKDGGA